tara:strand:+ start:534 stop:1238 length:705 start_codon:yes stop_codon:yes gene_type:complete
MPTLGTQTISSSFAQLLKTFTTGGIDGALQVITDGDNTSSALSLSTTGVSSTGSFSVDGASTLTGLVTFGSSITASTGTATIGTLFASGPATFGTSITASTGTATIGTEIVGTSTIGTLGVTNTATVGTLRVGAAGPRLTAVSYGTAAFTLSTTAQYNGASTTTGTFALTGCALGDIVFGSIDSLGTATGTYNIGLSFYPQATNVVRYAITNQGSTAGTIPAGIIYATAMRFTA